MSKTQKRVVKIVDTRTYILENEMNPKLLCNGNHPEDTPCSSKCKNDQKHIQFYTGYVTDKNEDGDQTCKRWIHYGELHDHANNALVELKLNKEYEPEEELKDNDLQNEEKGNVTMETEYALPTEMDEITVDELKMYKRTRFTVPIKRKREEIKDKKKRIK
jgi:hypothetical protein